MTAPDGTAEEPWSMLAAGGNRFRFDVPRYGDFYFAGKPGPMTTSITEPKDASNAGGVSPISLHLPEPHISDVRLCSRMWAWRTSVR